MARRKSPPIKIDPGVVPVITANPNTISDGVLKLASVGATIFAAKIFLDAFADDDMITWLSGKDTTLNGHYWMGAIYYGPIGDLLRTISMGQSVPGLVGAAISSQASLAQMIDGLNQRVATAKITYESLKEEIVRFTATVAVDRINAQTYVASLAEARSALDNYVNSNIYRAELAEQAATGVTINDPTLRQFQDNVAIAEARLFDPETSYNAVHLKEITAQEAQANAEQQYKKLLSEQTRWILAVVGGIIIATTMIYAGDSIIDLMSGTFGSIFNLIKVV